jgi:hypothetical protein
MDLNLTFINGRISGEGIDDIGCFRISGIYDAATLDCQWVKQYIGMHSVDYSGGGETRGIWGTWKLPGDHGGFHIWPLKSGIEAAATECNEVAESAQSTHQNQPLVTP